MKARYWPCFAVKGAGPSVGEVRVPIVQKPGKRYRYDSEYKRNGTANFFVTVDANRSWRKVKSQIGGPTRTSLSACATSLTSIILAQTGSVS
jgi:hypothetical protein